MKFIERIIKNFISITISLGMECSYIILVVVILLVIIIVLLYNDLLALGNFAGRGFSGG